MSGTSNRQPILVRYLNCPELMGCMMQRTGVNAADAACADGGLAWLEASTKCVFCRHVEKCCKWLEGSDSSSSPADFCRNAEFFRTCVEHSSIGASTDVEPQFEVGRLSATIEDR
jgi:hypothetical protein